MRKIRLIVMLFMVVIFSFLGGAMSYFLISYPAAVAQTKDPNQDQYDFSETFDNDSTKIFREVIEAHEFRLVDENHNIRGNLKTRNGKASLELLDPEGKSAQIDIAVHPDGLAAINIGSDESSQIKIAIRPNIMSLINVQEGNNAITMYTTDSVIRLGLRKEKMGSAIVLDIDSLGTARLLLGGDSIANSAVLYSNLAESNSGMIIGNLRTQWIRINSDTSGLDFQFLNNRQTIMLLKASNSNLATLYMYDEEANPRLLMGITLMDKVQTASYGLLGKATVPHISLFDKANELIWTAP